MEYFALKYSQINAIVQNRVSSGFLILLTNKIIFLFT